MAVKIYISGMSGNKEVKKRQQRVLMILDSKNIKYETIDITEPGAEADKEFMQTKATFKGSTVDDPDPRTPLPPQMFNDDQYCGDYNEFDLANEIDTLEKFLKLIEGDYTVIPTADEIIKESESAAKENDVEADGEVNAD